MHECRLTGFRFDLNPGCRPRGRQLGSRNSFFTLTGLPKKFSFVQNVYNGVSPGVMVG